MATIVQMRARHPALDTFEVPDEGHAPLLVETEVISRIVEFIGRCDRTTH
jgi:hypothetical protein